LAHRVPGSEMIRLESISKSFRNTIALNSFTLTIPQGRTTVLIGPSGCGKSTLIRIIAGLVRPDSGTVHIGEQELNARNVLELRRRMGYVIQQGGLFPHMTARRNVALVAEYLGWPKPDIDRRLAVLSELTKFPRDGLDRFPMQLSGGQNQRVSLMRALMLDPGILLLDEPLAALDPLIRAELQRDLRDIFQALNKTVVLVTHDLGEAAYLGDEIVLMKDGAIVQQGNIRELLEHPAGPYVTRFIQAQRSPLEGLRREGS
jgi:osmoprotectant transport system ATP-binding protein